MSVEHYINPDHYHPDAVAAATAGEVSALPMQGLVLRLGIALRDGNLADADAVFEHPSKPYVVGHELFQLTTGRMFLAHKRNDRDAFFAALAEWLGGRRQYPGNWNNAVLQEQEFAPWLAAVDPQKLAPPPPTAPRQLTEEDRAYVRNFEAVRRAAIQENLQWLREMGLTESVDELAGSYALTFVNRELREATVCRKDDAPCIIMAFDGDGTFVGSFLAH
jgi:hypothetical protein